MRREKRFVVIIFDWLSLDSLWQDVGIIRRQNVPKVAQKIATTDFTFKVTFFLLPRPISQQTFLAALLPMTICRWELSMICKSGHSESTWSVVFLIKNKNLSIRQNVAHSLLFFLLISPSFSFFLSFFLSLSLFLNPHAYGDYLWLLPTTAAFRNNNESANIIYFPKEMID